MAVERDLVKQVKRLLGRLIRARRLVGDSAEAEMNSILREIDGLPRAGLLEAIDSAVGRSVRRRDASLYVLGALADVPEAVARIGDALSHPDSELRQVALSTIEENSWRQLAPQLNRVILEDPDELCRGEAIRVAGVLKEDVNWPVILDVARSDPVRVARTLKDYGREEGRPYLQAAFRGAEDKAHKVIAAWGLAKLGDLAAIEYLGKMLYDPVVKTPTYHLPGESLRAAQAMADVFDLPFEWNAQYVPPIQEWWEANKERVLQGGKRPN
jgi:hypothetical protein